MCNFLGRDGLCVFGTPSQRFICTATQRKGVSNNTLLTFKLRSGAAVISYEKFDDSERSFRAYVFSVGTNWI
jgi:hypothetical protein